MTLWLWPFPFFYSLSGISSLEPSQHHIREPRLSQVEKNRGFQPIAGVYLQTCRQRASRSLQSSSAGACLYSRPRKSVIIMDCCCMPFRVGIFVTILVAETAGFLLCLVCRLRILTSTYMWPLFGACLTPTIEASGLLALLYTFLGLYPWVSQRKGKKPHWLWWLCLEINIVPPTLNFLDYKQI